MRKLSYGLGLWFSVLATMESGVASAQGLIPAEVLKLKNGMTAVLHVDRRQPSVAVLLYYRIGARHETAGRTGLAHLFEHLQFRGSQHMLPYSPFWYLQKCGARSSNGSTSFDKTLYYEVVPSVNLEPILWVESDRMGFPAIKALDMDDERKIVKNERRQRFEITPYGAARELANESFEKVLLRRALAIHVHDALSHAVLLRT